MMTKVARCGLAIGIAAVGVQLFIGGNPAVADFPQAADSTRGVAYATILHPLSLTYTSSMNFGTVMPNHTGGMMLLFPNSDFTARGVTVIDKNEVKSGEFTIFGTRSQVYSITLPRTATFASGAGTISVATFTHDAGGTPTLDLEGIGIFNMGAILKIGARPPTEGTYYGGVDVIISNQ